MNKLVIDASVAVKWYTREDLKEQALRLRHAHINGEITLTAPSLLAYEVANALRYNPSLTPKDREDGITALFLLGIVLDPPTQESMIEANQLAIKYDCTIYDAVYLSLATRQDSVLITADQELAEKARETGKIKHLSSFTSVVHS